MNTNILRSSLPGLRRAFYRKKYFYEPKDYGVNNYPITRTNGTVSEAFFNTGYKTGMPKQKHIIVKICLFFINTVAFIWSALKLLVFLIVLFFNIKDVEE